MIRKTLFLLATLSLSSATVAAETAAAKARYAEDKKLCAEESNSGARMQCLRDAKAEYDKAVAGAKKAPDATNYASPAASRGCTGCGKVVSVRAVEKEGEGSALGLVAGGVAGAVLGHQVGGGRGKNLATIAGAAGGAYAGNKIEKNMKKSKTWEVVVRFDNGDEKTYHFDNDPGLASGAEVEINGNSIVRR